MSTSHVVFTILIPFAFRVLAIPNLMVRVWVPLRVLVNLFRIRRLRVLVPVISPASRVVGNTRLEGRFDRIGLLALR